MQFIELYRSILLVDGRVDTLRVRMAAPSELVRDFPATAVGLHSGMSSFHQPPSQAEFSSVRLLSR